MNTSTHSLDITLDPVDNQRLANLCGQFDEHLRLIERRMGVEINNRGNTFRIIGKKKSVEETEEILHELYRETDKNTLTPELVHLHLHDVGSEPVDSRKKRSGEEVVIQTKRGQVRGRGVSQQHYLRSIADYDVSFGVGPAGTGKTYVAVVNALSKLRNGDIKKITHIEFWGMVFSVLNWFSPPRCMLCSDVTCELADISVGSGWFPYLAYGNINQSLIITRNQLSEKILQDCKCKEKIELVKVDNEKLIKLKEMEKYKKDRLKTHMSIFRLFGKKTPYYIVNGSLPDPTFRTYLAGILLYTSTFLSSKRYLWGLIATCKIFSRRVSTIILRK